jgi:predicted O-methyltransferase YrrM
MRGNRARALLCSEIRAGVQCLAMDEVNVNAVLHSILSSESVTDGERTFPLRHPDFPALPVHMDEDEGALLQAIVRRVKPRVSVEIGFAYGVSTLYICDALAEVNQSARHIVMDPFQSTQWRGIGLHNVRQAGFGSMVDFREDHSEIVLPELVRSGLVADFALIDGRHTFDQVMVEFYYLNRLLRVGGVMAFDDADRRSVNRVIRHALTYPAYRVFDAGRSHADRVSLAGRLRRTAVALPGAAAVLRPDFVKRDWDLGVHSTCVALEKVGEDRRTSGWDRAF